MISCVSTNTTITASTTSGKATSLEEAHPERLGKTYIGMSIAEFKDIWPEATRSGLSSEGETYEFVYTHLIGGTFGPNASDFKIYAYFYFTNDELVRYESQRKNPF
jgi:hypothetical protein